MSKSILTGVMLGALSGFMISGPSAIEAFARGCMIDNNFRKEMAAAEARSAASYDRLRLTLEGLIKEMP